VRTAALVLAVALGVGSNAAVYGFGRGVAPSVFPPAQTERVVVVLGTGADGNWMPLSHDAYLSVRRQTALFEWVGAARESMASVRIDASPSILPVAEVSPEVAELLRLRAAGTPAGARVEAPPALDGVFWGRPVAVWSIRDLAGEGDSRGTPPLWVLGKLKPALSMSEAERRLNGGGSAGLMVTPYTGVLPDAALALSRLMWPLRAAAGAGLFVACATIVGLLLARASARSRDTSLCVALGAGRSHLAREVLADAIVLIVLGGVPGALLAWWTIHAVPALLFESDATDLVVSLDSAGTAVAALVCLGVIAACLLVPLLRTPHAQPGAVLQRDGAGAGLATSWFRLALAATQMALCCVLLTVTGAFVESVRASARMPAGTRLAGAVMAVVEPQALASAEETRRSGLAFLQRLEAAARSQRGVAPLAWTAALPGGQPTWQRLRIEPAHPVVRDAELEVERFTAPDLRRLVMPPLAGRFFGGGDSSTACPVVVVSAAAAKEVFQGDALGRVITDHAGRSAQIIGVVDVRREDERPASRPVVFVYPAQDGRSPAPAGRAAFRVPAAPLQPEALLDAHAVSPAYFDVMGWPLVAGRLPSDDADGEGCRVAVVNQQASERYFGNDAVGAAVIDADGRRTEIVGVVRSASLRALRRRVEPAIYFPLAQDFRSSMTLLLSAPDLAPDGIADLRRALDGVPGRGPRPTIVQGLETYLQQTALAPIRIATALMGVSAV
jgi:hypothetical protein